MLEEVDGLEHAPDYDTFKEMCEKHPEVKMLAANLVLFINELGYLTNLQHLSGMHQKQLHDNIDWLNGAPVQRGLTFEQTIEALATGTGTEISAEETRRNIARLIRDPRLRPWAKPRSL